MASVVDPILVDNVTAELAKTYCILDDLIMKGNLIATRRKAELQQLEALLDAFKAREMDPQLGAQSSGTVNLAYPAVPANLHSGAGGDAIAQPDNDTSWMSNQPLEEWTWEAALDAEQLMNVADLLDVDQIDRFSADFNF